MNYGLAIINEKVVVKLFYFSFFNFYFFEKNCFMREIEDEKNKKN